MFYFRLRNSLSPSCSVTYSNPASMRAVDSLTLDVALQVHSSSSRLISCVYLKVVLRSLCPSCCLTSKRSLVLW